MQTTSPAESSNTISTFDSRSRYAQDDACVEEDLFLVILRPYLRFRGKRVASYVRGPMFGPTSRIGTSVARQWQGCCMPDPDDIFTLMRSVLRRMDALIERTPRTRAEIEQARREVRDLEERWQAYMTMLHAWAVELLTRATRAVGNRPEVPELQSGASRCKALLTPATAITTIPSPSSQQRSLRLLCPDRW
jgi:hypothetical protein